jgi:ApaG protein
MVSKISEGIQISVEVFYQEAYSNPIQHEYMFAYRITIENRNRYAVKLLSRNWYIFDSNGQRREVEGEGVVGIQPVIPSGKYFQYTSGCNITTDMGRMLGFYTMENQNTKTKFRVNIPPFDMIMPAKMN